MNHLNISAEEVSHRIIADHLRSSAFLIADGVLPSNEGRGYVLRRIMRRAMRHVHQLGAKQPMMYKLVPNLIQEMGGQYPELIRAKELIIETLKNEEEKFRTTLDRGLKLLEEETSNMKEGDVLSGEIAFKLYDTYGFPLDLTEDILRDRGISVDVTGFSSEMAAQKQRAKEAWTGSGEAKSEKIYFQIKAKVGETEFVGYEETRTKAKILAMIVNGEEANSAKLGDTIVLITDRTPFYGEAGGQIGDSGLVMKLSEDDSIKLPFSIIQITDTKKPLEHFNIHIGKVESGTFELGDNVSMTIDPVKRQRIKANHSATHLLHFALQKILGKSVAQKGSYVSDSKLRLDVNYSKGISKSELKKAEEIVNSIIIQNVSVCTEVMGIEEARSTGATALFGEKYSDKVRVVSIKHEEDESGNTDNIPLETKDGGHTLNDISSSLSAAEKTGDDYDFSMEFCGGTHIERTGNIGFFKIVSEESVAAGIRRVEAVTGIDALDFVNSQLEVVQEVSSITNTPISKLTHKSEDLINEVKALKKEVAKLKKDNLLANLKSLPQEKIGNVNFVSQVIKDAEAKDLRELVLELKAKKEYVDNTVIGMIGTFEDKVSIVIGISKNLTDKIDATSLIGPAVEKLGGKGGGGKPDLAMGGGTDDSKTAEAFDIIKQKISEGK